MEIHILGAGLVGLTLALALAQRMQPAPRIHLIDAQPAPSGPPQHIDTDKPLALNAASVMLYQQLGLWPHLAPYCTAIQALNVSEAGRIGYVHLRAQAQGYAALGMTLPARWLQYHLYQAAQQQGIVIHNNHCINRIEPLADRVRLHSDTLSWDSPLLVIAQGGASALTQALGMASQHIDYQQSALVSSLQAEGAQPGVAYQRYTPYGTVALLPAAGHCGLVISCSNLHRDYWQHGNRINLTALQHQLGLRLGRLQGAEAWHAYPLRAQHSTLQCLARIVLVGNAAMSLHPITAQGLNLGLFAVQQLTNHLARQPNWAQQPQLQSYCQAVAPQQQRIHRLTHRLVRFASSHSPFTLGLRSTALCALQLSSTAQRHFIRQFMGIHPSLDQPAITGITLPTGQPL